MKMFLNILQKIKLFTMSKRISDNKLFNILHPNLHLQNHKTDLEKFNLDKLFSFDDNNQISGINEQKVFIASETPDYKANYIIAVRDMINEDNKHKRITDSTKNAALKEISKKYKNL